MADSYLYPAYVDYRYNKGAIIDVSGKQPAILRLADVISTFFRSNPISLAQKFIKLS